MSLRHTLITSIIFSLTAALAGCSTHSTDNGTTAEPLAAPEAADAPVVAPKFAAAPIEQNDDDQPGIRVIPPVDNRVSESGKSQSFSVALNAKPESKVVIKVSSSDKSEGLADVQELTFMRENWNQPQWITVTGVDDKEVDGTVPFDIKLAVSYTKAANYKSVSPKTVTFECLDDDKADVKQNIAAPAPAAAMPKTTNGDAVKIRIMTANTTTGEDQSYDPGEGIRIFKAMKPDIVLIQEFNYTKNTIKAFVQSTFGTDYKWYRGKGDIPNGIISRYPIVQTGAWKSNRVSDRMWEWAVVDIPGERDLLAISVHLFTKDNVAEMMPLRKQIESKIAADKKNYYVILGGDFNQPDWTPIQKNLSGLVVVGTQYKDWPQDQNGQVRTNATRHKQLDYLLCSPDFCALETPVVIGKRSYPKGHIVDSRVYAEHNELSLIPPVKAGDSEGVKMQHMAVIRDFLVKP